MADVKLRPNQKKILRYRRGKMGISAVPGSGKTWTLSRLAAQIVRNGVLDDEQEVLVVTLVNSAVDNFSQRVSQFLGETSLLPNLGYRVRTLHGLAHDIVRERPALVGLADNFQIIDEREAESIRNDVARAWLQVHPYDLDSYLDPEMEEGKTEWVRREYLPDLVQGIALSFIRSAKDWQLTPEQARQRLDQVPLPLPMAEIGSEMYADYQRALNYRGAVDFDDLIRLALQALQADGDYLERLRHTWPYILEDEAQDSSYLQEQILSLLVGPTGNWVRVGDPNQAIYETFTTANPRYLRQFIQRADVEAMELPDSGRSTPSIIDLANYLVKWTQDEHPLEAVRNALQGPPYIRPTPRGDPQPNPPDEPDGIFLVGNKFSPQEEIMAVADSLERWLPEHLNDTVAVLAPRNTRGFEMVDELRRRKLEVVDSLLRSSTTTRSSAGALANLLQYLADPGSASKLARVYEVWRRDDRQEDQASAEAKRVASLLRKLRRVEDFLWPGPELDWLEQLSLSGEAPQAVGRLAEFRQLVRRWQGAVLLPVDQIVLTISQDLLSQPAELAISHKLAVLLRQAGQAHPDWQLPEMTEELGMIARNERRFIGFSEEDTGFDPEQHRGKVVVATMHKAKGLEWDRVYLMSVSNYDFPSGMEYDRFIAEKWFVRGSLNLESEALAQLEAANSTDEYHWYQEGQASQEARLDYVRERLRLFYVGITRARKNLIVTWNTGRSKYPAQPALPLVALQTYWEERTHGADG
jgi:DNA helicase-2/ATP-dependent DNA helicase PcrA